MLLAPVIRERAYASGWAQATSGVRGQRMHSKSVMLQHHDERSASATDRVGEWRVQLLLLKAHEGRGELRFGSIEHTGLRVVVVRVVSWGGCMRCVKCDGVEL